MENYNFYEQREADAKFDLGSAMQLPDVEPGEEYHPSDALKKAVNVALMLQKPLLLTGQPGTGKSELAWHVARHFGWGKPEVFVTRTDSTATDLLYRYDSLAHFNRVNMQKAGHEVLTAAQIEKMFIKYVALGRAMTKIARECVLKKFFPARALYRFFEDPFIIHKNHAFLLPKYSF